MTTDSGNISFERTLIGTTVGWFTGLSTFAALANEVESVSPHSYNSGPNRLAILGTAYTVAMTVTTITSILLDRLMYPKLNEHPPIQDRVKLADRTCLIFALSTMTFLAFYALVDMQTAIDQVNRTVILLTGYTVSLITASNVAPNLYRSHYG